MSLAGSRDAVRSKNTDSNRLCHLTVTHTIPRLPKRNRPTTFFTRIPRLEQKRKNTRLQSISARPAREVWTNVRNAMIFRRMSVRQSCIVVKFSNVCCRRTMKHLKHIETLLVRAIKYTSWGLITDDFGRGPRASGPPPQGWRGDGEGSDEHSQRRGQLPTRSSVAHVKTGVCVHRWWQPLPWWRDFRVIVKDIGARSHGAGEVLGHCTGESMS